MGSKGGGKWEEGALTAVVWEEPSEGKGEGGGGGAGDHGGCRTHAAGHDGGRWHMAGAQIRAGAGWLICWGGGWEVVGKEPEGEEKVGEKETKDKKGIMLGVREKGQRGKWKSSS